MKKTIDSARPKTLADSVEHLDMIMERDLMKMLGQEKKIPVQFIPELPYGFQGSFEDDHDCHHSQYGEDGCDCDRYIK